MMFGAVGRKFRPFGAIDGVGRSDETPNDELRSEVRR